ncbi:hypothetical protein B296_00011008 [Ensete ventricosum]|uniref:GDSL esterase/lipase n=1 Tax=Ensete ventricosum TaxID=4639 RepID=A0A426ZKT3_ENSVE|nr:hypothetical protein B296_00011008 [Ensete ventricosum]
MAETPVWLLFMAFSSLPLLPWCKGGDEAAVKGMFVFGSSLVDNGNNNFLRNSKARADYSPYGIDFPWGPSGRFSNGRNPVDVLGQLLMLPSLIPPFADPETKGRRIAHGGEVMNLSSQIGNFEDKTLPELKAQLRKGGSRRVVANRFLSQYLFVVGTGGNDYLLNFFAGDAKNSTTMSEFTHHLVSIFSAQLKVKFSCQYDHIDAVCGVTFLVTKITSLLQKLYDLGARKFVLFSIQAMGCVPVVRATVPTANGGCVEAMNEAAILFNSHLRRLADASRRRRMPGSFVVYVNSYKIIRDIINNPIPCGTYLRGLRAACPSAEASFQVSRRRARRAASCHRPWRTGEGYCAEGEGVPAAIATLTSSSTGFTLLMLSI